jgi:uncharacterized protein YrzB (UPF0473 family)
MEPKTIIITDDQGKEHTFNVLFTHTTKEKVSFVFYVDPQDDESVFCSRYDDQGKLFDLNEKEQMLASMVLKRFEESDQDDEEDDWDEEVIEEEDKSGI